MVFRSLIRNWLGGAARQRIRRTVVEAAREKRAEAETTETETPSPEERPCDVGVVFALEIESGGLEDLLEGVVGIQGHRFVVRQGRLEGRHVVVVRSGAGPEAAGHATEALILGHHPQWVISAGFAGGLTPKLNRHDLVMPDGLVNTAGDRLAIDVKVDAASLAQIPQLHVGRLLSVDHVVRLPEEKRALGEKHHALAVDMETFAVAETCRRHQVQFLAARIVTDTADDELPPEVQHLMRQKTRAAKLGAVVGAAWRRLSSVKDMLKLKENALVASDRLARFLASTIERLVPLPPEATDEKPNRQS